MKSHARLGIVLLINRGTTLRLAASRLLSRSQYIPIASNFLPGHLRRPRVVNKLLFFLLLSVASVSSAPTSSPATPPLTVSTMPQAKKHAMKIKQKRLVAQEGGPEAATPQQGEALIPKDANTTEREDQAQQLACYIANRGYPVSRFSMQSASANRQAWGVAVQHEGRGRRDHKYCFEFSTSISGSDHSRASRAQFFKDCASKREARDCCCVPPALAVIFIIILGT